MHRNIFYSFLLSTAIAASGWKISPEGWLSETHKIYTIFYREADSGNKDEYMKLVDNGIKSVHIYFDNSFDRKFDVYVHPGRQSLDSQWRKDLNKPGFKSECWMVASGTAARLDMISPKRWDKESCEHTYSDKIKVQQLITHELFHVFHGQLNPGGDFSKTENIEWFVEGLATYASGQLDSARQAEVKSAITNKTAPNSLNDFWKGKSGYGLSGSIVMYIDMKYGRKKLKNLLSLSKKSAILSSLNITEEALLTEWKTFFGA